MEKRFVSAEELAEILGVRTNLIWELAREGKIPCLHVGRLYRFNPEEVLEHLKYAS